MGYLRCRPFYRARDAHAAIAAMGLFPSQLGATRVVVTYEHADMALEWEDPAADEAPTGIVVVDAGPDAARDGHTVWWHPGPPDRYPGRELPVAVAQLLAVWREPRAWSETEFLDIYRRWEQGGYAVRWAPRPEGEYQPPGWTRLLAPVM